MFTDAFSQQQNSLFRFFIYNSLVSYVCESILNVWNQKSRNWGFVNSNPLKFCGYSCSSPASSLVWLFWLSCCWLDHCSTSYPRCVCICTSLPTWESGKVKESALILSFISLPRQYWHASMLPASGRCSCSSRTYLSCGESARLTL